MAASPRLKSDCFFARTNSVSEPVNLIITSGTSQGLVLGKGFHSQPVINLPNLFELVVFARKPARCRVQDACAGGFWSFCVTYGGGVEG